MHPSVKWKAFTAVKFALVKSVLVLINGRNLSTLTNFYLMKNDTSYFFIVMFIDVKSPGR